MDRRVPIHAKDPHAHVIHKPGPRLMHHVPLAFVWNKVTGKSGRSPSAALNLVSFIDFLVTTVIFLLSSFSASGAPTIDKSVKLPKAENVDDLVEAPIVAVNGSQILVDGLHAGSTRPAEEIGRVQKVEELFAVLTSKRTLWRQIQPNQPFPGVVILQIDQNVPAIVVKSVFSTATLAGYPNVSFMVGKTAHTG